MNKLKDFLYEVSDLILAAIILTFMLSVVGWQLYGWFTPQDFSIDYNKPEEIVITIPKEDSISNDSKTIDTSNSTTSSNESNQDQSKQVETPPAESTNTKNNQIIQEENTLISFSISNGDSGYKIDSKLLDLGLIKQKGDFVNKIIELKLDSKIKIGDYQIKKGSSIEDIINQITRK